MYAHLFGFWVSVIARIVPFGRARLCLGCWVFIPLLSELLYIVKCDVLISAVYGIQVSCYIAGVGVWGGGGGGGRGGGEGYITVDVCSVG